MTATFRKLALSAIFAVSTVGTLTMTSCNKDPEPCAVGYEGTDCKTMINAKFIGAYDGNETCTIGTDSYILTLTSVSTDNMKLTITNLYNDATTLNCTITGSNEFSISGVADGTTYTGTGTLSGSTLTIKYTGSDGVISNSCTFTGTKK